MLRPTAVAVKAENHNRILVTFDNGELRRFDVSPLIHGEFYGELADPAYFSMVTVAGLSVEWPHGQDVCPDDLYYNSVSA